VPHEEKFIRSGMSLVFFSTARASVIYDCHTVSPPANALCTPLIELTVSNS
jgi:hypothetical protein